MNWIKKMTDGLRSLLGGKNRKKLIENCVVIILIGIVLMIVGGSIFGGKSKKDVLEVPDKKGVVDTAGKSMETGGKDRTEAKLEEILSQIDGAGRVKVMITYISGKEIVPAYNIRSSQSNSSEKDSSGGTRDVDENEQESSIVYEEEQGSKKPVVLKDLEPVVKGVVVVADGAGNPGVKDNIIKAVQVLTDIPLHKVQVFERKR